MNFNYLTDPDFEGGLQVAFSSSSAEAAKKCFRLLYFQKVLGIRLKGSSLPLDFGTAFHHGMFVFNSTPGDHNLRVTAGIRGAFEAFEGLDGDAKRNANTLARAVTLTCDANRDMKFLQTPEGPAVERKLQVEISDGVFIYGKLDAVEDCGLTYPLDYKTTTKPLTDWYWGPFERSSQITMYTLLGVIGFPDRRPAGLKIQAVSVSKDKVDIQTRIFHRTPTQLERWKQTLVGVIDRIHEISLNEDITDMHSWPENDTACFGCSYVPICSASDARKQSIINNFYEGRPNGKATQS